MMAAYFLGIDIGTSSIKAAIWNAETGATLSSTSSDLPIYAAAPGWAEQDVEEWWSSVVQAIQSLPADARSQVQAVGITYQMHGLVLLDEDLLPIRRSIIWCDSRATPYGERAVETLGQEYCFHHLLNSPGNFTASKLAWVRENESENYKRSKYALLPGDYLAARLTGEVATTNSGLSEMILWDFTERTVAQPVLDALDLDSELIPARVPTFGHQGRLTAGAASILGLETDIPVSYRAGDQPNNAFSLGCLNPGDVASTAGTSGVVYGVSDTPILDPDQRFNTFLHVNDTPEVARYGQLLCINGCGSLYSWLRNNLFDKQVSFSEMNALAAEAPAGSEGLLFFPFGNGAERILANRELGGSLENLNFQLHDRRHICRAAQEGIAFALRFGMEAGITAKTIRAGDANLFLSEVFCQTFSNLTGARLEIWNTDGAVGAARGAAVGSGYFAKPEDAFKDIRVVRAYEPEDSGPLNESYANWKQRLLFHDLWLNQAK
jgi:xylulokinase